MELIPKHFDQEHGLTELLSSVSKEKLDTALRQLLGSPYRLVTVSGEMLIGDAAPQPGMVRAQISHDLEAVGHLEVASTNEASADKIAAQANGAAMLIELLLQGLARYYMASALHLEAVHSDYEALQEKHRALQESEKRYRDLAESLEAEVKRQVAVIESAQRRLYESEKLASVGQLAAGVAHEINNPIGFIKSNLGTAQSYAQRLNTVSELIRSSSDSSLREGWQQADGDYMLEDFPTLLGECIHGADRVARIVADLKAFSNVDLANVRQTDVNEQIRMATEMAKMAYAPNVSVVMQLDELPNLACQAGRLNQALLNILHNAGLAISSGGTVTITSRCENDCIVLRIEDDGCGMTPEILARAFEPFFTTRDVGKGTGLGLTVARDIIRSHSGEISLESRPGSGTSVTITLPLLQPTA